MSVLTEEERDMMLQKVYAMLTELMARAEKPRRVRKRGPAPGTIDLSTVPANEIAASDKRLAAAGYWRR